MTDLLVPVAALAAELGNMEIVYVSPDAGYGCPVEPGETYRWGERTEAMWIEEDIRESMGMVLIRDAAYGDYMPSSTYTRANFEALQADFPDTFLQMGLSEYDGMTLALPLGAKIPELLADALRKLEDYPVYDEEVMCRIEMELVDQEWENSTRYELLTEVAQYFNTTPALPCSWNVAELTWDEMDQYETFREAADFTNHYPVFESATSCYWPDIAEIAADVALRIMIARERELNASFV